MKQYIALGMVPAGTAVPSGGGSDSSTPGVTPTPETPPPTGSPPPPDGSPPAGGPTPPPPVSGPAPPGKAGDKAALKANKDINVVTVPSAKNGAESPEFTNAGAVNWDKAPAALQALKPQIEAASKASGTPESIIASVIWSESRGKIDVAATDGGTDAGLMQIDNKTYDTTVAGKHGLPHGNTPTDKDQNIMAGAIYLHNLKEKFGSWDVALRAYNSGEYAGTDRNDPDATPAGTGIKAYVQFARAHVLDLQDGTLDPNT
jgi:soluble lytic murein transglycosylase-like protein